MESLRDIKRAMEREVKKESCPIMFDRLEFGGEPFQTITSEEKPDEVEYGGNQLCVNLHTIYCLNVKR